jgi:excisionase family DNA binding protein
VPEGQGGTVVATYGQSGGTNPAQGTGIPQLLTLAEVAVTLAVAAEAVEELVAAGELRAIRVRGQFRVTVVALRQFLADVEVKAPLRGA